MPLTLGFLFLYLQPHMNRIKIIADNKIPFLKGVLDDVAQVSYLPGHKISNKEILDADAFIIRTRTKCDEGLLQNSSIKFIASATIGYDHIDTEYCKTKGIAWTNAPGCNASSVEQYVVAALLELAIRLGFELSSKTIGIVGVGHVGSKVARAASALGMRVLLNDPPRKRNENLPDFVDLETLQKEADIVSFHIPLNPEGEDKTLNLADEKFFKKLKKGTILINTSRGDIVDEIELEKAIDNNIISATVLDVWRNEPSLNLDLLKKITLATPHIAGYSADGKAKGTEMSVQALSKKFNLGLDYWKPKNIPNPENAHIEVDCLNKSKEQVIYEAYKHSYSINKDDFDLKKSPELFEELRGNYPNRREAKAYTIKLLNDDSGLLKKMFQNIGFAL